ncbi:Signal transduction histidine kinase [Daejeonella rubra]|uniref:histidine kinase n=1 Tax=Daejeonella rubra TaxID=990371 RepID=A0A1G9X1W3_9SPHI|nr:hybrid sensor histidine kinase/response regulator [Daejeonella rubra]SDM90698.1 Signal transduction histidine kinase [Daejeonella rubra]
MTADLKILILEDNRSDADLLQRELKKSGLIFTSEIVQTRVDFEIALQNFNPDIILSDYSLPAFDAVSAFHITQSISPLIPFIIVSGVIGEENAVELIKNGVTDYTPKDKLFTLSTKINRALKDTEERKEKKAISEKLKTQTVELIIANKELILQNDEKEKRTADLIILSEALEAQKEELRRANEDLYEKAQLLLRQEEKLIRINDDLFLLNQDLEKRVFERTCELENLNHELKDLNLSKDKFLSVISHDLRNPITALMISSDKLGQDAEKSIFDKVQPLAKIIHRTSNQILQQLNELVEWAQMQREKVSFNSEKLNLFQIVDQSFELLKANALQKNIVLENKVPFDIYVSADTLMLRSILQNLVTNAIKYTPKEGFVTVSAQLKDKMVEVCITDTGIGMEEDVLKKLFTNSNSSSVSGTNNEKGSGLGLILVKDFVIQHGGTIRAESEIDKGTRMIFSVPGY